MRRSNDAAATPTEIRFVSVSGCRKHVNDGYSGLCEAWEMVCAATAARRGRGRLLVRDLSEVRFFLHFMYQRAAARSGEREVVEAAVAPLSSIICAALLRFAAHRDGCSPCVRREGFRITRTTERTPLALVSGMCRRWAHAASTYARVFLENESSVDGFCEERARRSLESR